MPFLSLPNKEELVREACRSLDLTLASPTALHSGRTYAVHHWQCSWCRDDEELRREVPLAELLAKENISIQEDEAEVTEHSVEEMKDVADM
ncbi:hypothetical protein AK812_SmicGene26531 [Symbiodinium microadriaticum]|uniref:Uncharacterized protein n=1 Tax=Symbiodinium microadriaticum TaxID=2951 RepID=A0A1Q9D995_SYMMI|nr:hypothetical protein AK812_SmicGene26531 [Symbiodinium microadriaticum]